MRRASPLCVAAAKKLLKELDVRSPVEIEIELIAAHCGAAVEKRNLAHEEGHLIRAGATGLIVVNTAAFRSDKWRFVVGHELGHFLRHKDLDQFNMCTTADLYSWYRGSPHEAEASDFAAELLMPETMFAPACKTGKPTLQTIKKLAEEFRVSLTAAAVRFAGFTPEPCGIVHSTAGKIDWSCGSEDFELRIESGSPTPKGSFAADIFAGKDVPDRPQSIPASTWSHGASPRWLIAEHSLKLGSYESVLTLLRHRYSEKED